MTRLQKDRLKTILRNLKKLYGEIPNQSVRDYLASASFEIIEVLGLQKKQSRRSLATHLRVNELYQAGVGYKVIQDQMRS